MVEEEGDLDRSGGSWEPEVEDAEGIEFGEGGLEEFLKCEEGKEIRAREIKSRARAYSAHSVDECWFLPPLKLDWIGLDWVGGKV